MTKSMKWAFVLGCLVMAGLSYGAKEFVDRYGGQYPVFFSKGLYIGTEGASNPTSDKQNKLTGFRAVTYAYDFAALDPTTSGGLNQTETPTIPSLGVKYSDGCVAASNLGADGGVGMPATAALTCRSVTDGVVGRLRAHPVTDGGTGAVNLPDAGYTFYIFSNQ